MVYLWANRCPAVPWCAPQCHVCSEIHRALQLNVRWRTVQQLRVSLMGGSVTQCSLCQVVHKTASILILRVQCTQCVEICTAVERSALMQSLLRTAMHSFSFLPSCSLLLLLLELVGRSGCINALNLHLGKGSGWEVGGRREISRRKSMLWSLDCQYHRQIAMSNCQLSIKRRWCFSYQPYINFWSG